MCIRQSKKINEYGGGRGKILHPPKKGQRVRSQFRRGSIIVSYHLKTMCGNFHACIMILQLMPFPVPRTSQVDSFFMITQLRVHRSNTLIASLLSQDTSVNELKDKKRC